MKVGEVSGETFRLACETFRVTIKVQLPSILVSINHHSILFYFIDLHVVSTRSIVVA